jgi:hypothetical protein
MNGETILQAQANSISNTTLWIARILTVLLALFFLMDAVMKIVKAAPAMEGTVQAGYPAGAVAPIGWTLLICLAFYLIPRTSILGAILLTGYLGGATATMVRTSNRFFFLPIIFGMLSWLPLYLREDRLRALVPLRKES